MSLGHEGGISSAKATSDGEFSYLFGVVLYFPF